MTRRRVLIKTFISTLAFQMISEGRVALDDTVDRHFAPELYARTLLGDEEHATTLATISMPGGDAYGLGIMRRETAWGPMWGHDNEQPGFARQMWYLPDQETTIVVLANGIEKEALAELVQEVLAVVIEGP